MTDEEPDQPDTTTESESGEGVVSEPEWQRRRQLAAVFGDVLPETTSDERDQDPPEAETAGDRWLRAQVPPHHG